MPSYQKILVGVDGSHSSEAAFYRAIEVAKEYHAKLYIVHITEDRLPAAPMDAGAIAIEMDRDQMTAGTLLDDYEKLARNHGLKHITTLSNSGSPKMEILSFASMHEADLIVCGATGLNAMERIFIGSVSQYITRHANCDVLIARNSTKIETSGLSIKSTSQR
ncbi:universal stress protein [Fictibacillus fluitans]|uniref:Universal stress protein n=1 Tax=Fictibacillus fluitans TaxID=3058422 RepID=A0ABT8HQY0_9BACL|nr:universal stress protein [Fictibacillus sp. NE201]MDN4523164.1 universal stress protein [Fictibacillus sp. NE201]